MNKLLSSGIGTYIVNIFT